MSARPLASPTRKEIEAWVKNAGDSVCRLTELKGDVSVRRYFRAELETGNAAIVALYPPEMHGACNNFVETTRILSSIGVRVPAVLISDCHTGLMLLEDVGPSTLYDYRKSSWSHLRPRFLQAVKFIDRIRSIPVAEALRLNPPLDRDLLWKELEQTWNLFLEPRRLVGGEPFASRLRTALAELCERLGSDKPVTCHRDFMARNLVPIDSHPSLVVLDHQDLRPGPKFYDLASLLNDSLFPPPAIAEEVLGDRISGFEDRLAYHRAATQRTLKAVGTFEAFSQRGFTRHETLIPPTLTRALSHLCELPETGSLSPELRRLWRPFLTRVSRPTP